jgi:hypothetical protein
VAQFHNEKDEPKSKGAILIPIDDNRKFNMKDYRDKLYQIISNKKKEIARKG